MAATASSITGAASWYSQKCQVARADCAAAGKDRYRSPVSPIEAQPTRLMCACAGNCERQPLAISRARAHQPGWLGFDGAHRAPIPVLSRGGAVRPRDLALLAVPAGRASDAARGRGHLLRLRESRAGRRRCLGSGAGFDPALLVGDFLGAQKQGSLAAIAAARIHTEAWAFVI